MYVCTFRRLSLFRKVILPIFVLSVTLLLALFLRSVTADRGMAAVIRNLAFRSPADPLSMITSALECVLCDSFLVSGAVVCLASFNRFNQKVKGMTRYKVKWKKLYIISECFYCMIDTSFD